MFCYNEITAQRPQVKWQIQQLKQIKEKAQINNMVEIFIKFSGHRDGMEGAFGTVSGTGGT